MREVDGEANSETLIDVIERGTGAWHSRLQPVTGRKHQLRVHMAALGAPIVDANVYPTLTKSAGVDDFSRPLQQIGRSSCRVSVCQDVVILVVAGSIKKKPN